MIAPDIVVALDQDRQDGQQQNDQCCYCRDEHFSLLLLVLTLGVQTSTIWTSCYPTILDIESVQIDPDTILSLRVLVCAAGAVKNVLVEICVLKSSSGQAKASVAVAHIR